MSPCAGNVERRIEAVDDVFADDSRVQRRQMDAVEIEQDWFCNAGLPIRSAGTHSHFGCSKRRIGLDHTSIAGYSTNSTRIPSARCGSAALRVRRLSLAVGGAD